MLRHLSSRRSFWFCSHCRLEIPDTDKVINSCKKSTVQFNSPVFKAPISSHTSSHQVAAF